MKNLSSSFLEETVFDIPTQKISFRLLNFIRVLVFVLVLTLYNSNKASCVTFPLFRLGVGIKISAKQKNKHLVEYELFPFSHFQEGLSAFVEGFVEGFSCRCKCPC